METNPFLRSLDGWTREGWIKGAMYRWEHYVGEIDGWCSLGRLDQACNNSYGYVEAWQTLGRVFNDLFPDRLGENPEFEDPIPMVNDHPDTTFEDIQAAFEKAAVRWEEQI